MTLPVLFAEITDTIIHVTDTAFLARVGTIELAALAFADTLFDIWTVPVIGIVGAMQIIIARRVGEQREHTVGPNFFRGMSAVLGTSLVLLVALKVAAPALSELLAESSQVADGVNTFLQIAAYGLVFYSLSLGYVALFIGIGRTRVLVSATLVLALTNLVLSYGLILGRLGMPALGIEGAAWAFVGAEAVTFAFLTWRVLRGGLMERYGRFVLRSPRDGTLGRMGALGLPISLQALLEAVRWLAFFFILQQVGHEAVALSNILYACYGVLLIPASAFAETTDALVSNVIGRGGGDGLRRLLRRITASAYTVMAPVLLVAGLAPDVALWVFATEPVPIAGAVPALRVVAFGMLVIVPAELWLSAVDGTGATDVAFVIDFVASAVLIGVTYATAMVLGLPLAFAWSSLIFAAGTHLVLSYWWVRSRRWATRRV